MNEYYRKKLHILISIAAALVVAVICVLKRETLYDMSVSVSAAIVAFYILGAFVRAYLMANVFPPPLPEELVPDELVPDELTLDEALTGEDENVYLSESDNIPEMEPTPMSSDAEGL